MVAPKKKTLLYIGLAAGAALLAFGAKSIVDAKFLNWQIQDFKLSPTGGQIALGIINPTSSSYTVNSLNIDILDNDSRVATASYMGQLVILPMATTTLLLTITLDASGILTTLFSAGAQLLQKGSDSDIAQGTATEEITIHGSANVDGIMIPVDADLTTVKV